MSFPVVQSGEFVSCESLFAFAGQARGSIASASLSHDSGEGFADLRNRNRRRVFFFPDGLPSPGTR